MGPELTLVLVALGLGYLARKLGRFPEDASEALNRFVIEVCLPATILRLVPRLQMRWDLLLLVLTPWLLVGLSFVASRLLGRLLALDVPTRAALFLCTAIGNTSFLAFPLISALLGEQAISLAAVYDQFGSFLALSTVAPLAVVRASGGSALSTGAMVKRVLTFAPFLSLVIALLLPAELPGWLDQILLQLSRALVPVAMFAVGLRLRVTPPSERAAFAAGLTLKLVLFPALALGLCTLAGAAGPIRDVVVLEAAMPASITVGALAMGAGLAPRLAAALVGWGLVLAQLSVPAWSLLLR